MQNSSPAISVIIRSCNRPKLLVKALASVVAQNYLNTEVIIINEGKVSLRTIADDFSTQLQTVTLIEENLAQPRGRSAAAQLGLSTSTGQYLCFLDDDDWLLDNHFSVLINALENSPALAVYSAIDCVREGDEEQVISTYSEPFDRKKLFIRNYIPIHAVLFDRILLDYNVAFSSEFSIFEDWDFWLQVAQHTDFLHIPTVTAIYRVSTTGSGAHSDGRLQQNSREKVWNKWAQHLPSVTLIQLFQDTLNKENTYQTELAGYATHIKNYQRAIAEKNIELEHSQNKITQIENQQGVLQAVLENIRSNQLRINQKINYLLYSLPVIVCLLLMSVIF